MSITTHALGAAYSADNQLPKESRNNNLNTYAC
jgi:hypothetical protein